MMPPRVVLDTNILISALIFGGNPRTILKSALYKNIIAVTSPTLLAELADILSKKFLFDPSKISLVERKLKKKFDIVYPKQTIKVLADDPDNRVLEAAVEGNCEFVITGDKPLLALKKYRNIKIVSLSHFLSI